MNKKKLWAKGIVLVAIVAGLAYVTVMYAAPLTRFLSNANKVGDYLASFGIWGAAIFVLFQAVQVVIAPIPGEVTQFAGGFIYGTIPGTLFSMIGILMGSVVVFALGRWFGLPLLQVMMPAKSFDKFGFLLNHPKTELIIVMLFLIPGSPKDILTYIAGLTPVRPLHFFIAAMVARFPGILLSSYIGAHVEAKAYGPVIAASVIALGLFVAGVLMQDRMVRLVQRRKEKSGSGG
ncbi:MAG: VTT domain-containing protein [bacterium]